MRTLMIGLAMCLWTLGPAVASGHSDEAIQVANAQEGGDWEDFDYVDWGDDDGSGAVEESEPIVHEAFVDHGDTVRVVKRVYIEYQPPPVIQETIVRETRPSPAAIWIPGYWYHVRRVDSFVWVSGCWRVPPRGMAWRSGRYASVGSRWAWVPGAWTPSGVALTYYPSAPPAFRLEVVNHALCPGPDHIWASGHWKWTNSRYGWVAGKWLARPAGFVYVAARYHWTPRGYAFVAGYFDRPVARRGVAYRPMVVRHPTRIERIRPRTVYESHRLENRLRHARPAQGGPRSNRLVQATGSSSPTVRRGNRSGNGGRPVARQQPTARPTPRKAPTVVTRTAPRQSPAVRNVVRKPLARQVVKPSQIERRTQRVSRPTIAPTRARPTPRVARPTPPVARPTARVGQAKPSTTVNRRVTASAKPSPKRATVQRHAPSRGSSTKVSRSSAGPKKDR